MLGDTCIDLIRTPLDLGRGGKIFDYICHSIKEGQGNFVLNATQLGGAYSYTTLLGGAYSYAT